MSVNLLFNQLPPPQQTSTQSIQQQFSLPDITFNSSPSSSTFDASSLPSTSSAISPSTLLVAAAAKAAATTATLIQQQRNFSSAAATSINVNSDHQLLHHQQQQRIEELLLPALIGHEISNILSQAPSSSTSSYLQHPQPTWRCANLPTTLQVLNSARDNFPSYSSTIDSLRQSLTQTIFVSLINATTRTSSMNGIEMPAIASMAPNNTSLHLTPQNFLQPKIPENSEFPDPVEFQAPAIYASPDSMESSSRRESLLMPLSSTSPAKSEFSNSTDISSIDIRSDMSSLSIKSEKPGKSLKHIKKRVQCIQCQKSFCDKGALKIHNSSVHLREMHICTVSGCTKQFPSKRSRNRHSNNPNMHTDAGRRRNCRTTHTSKSDSISEDSLPAPPPLPAPAPQAPPPETPHGILSILHRLIPSGFQQQHQNATTTSSVLPLPQLPLPPQNPELNGLLRFMISQRTKPTLC